MGVRDPIEVLFHDVPTKKAIWAASELQLHALAPLTHPCPPPAWNDPGFAGRRGYIFTRQDHATPPSLQERMVKDSGVEWKRKELDTSHSPYLSKPKELVNHIIDMVYSFDVQT